VDVRVHQRLTWRYCAPVEQFGERRQCPLADHQKKDDFTTWCSKEEIAERPFVRGNNQCACRSGAPHLRLMHQHPVERVPTGDDHTDCGGVCAEQIGDQGIVIRAGFLAEQRCQQRSG
jgi:hypothetical protein